MCMEKIDNFDLVFKELYMLKECVKEYQVFFNSFIYKSWWYGKIIGIIIVLKILEVIYVNMSWFYGIVFEFGINVIGLREIYV